MNVNYLRVFTCAIVLLANSFVAFSQNPNELWREINNKSSVRIGERSSIPTEYLAFELDLPKMKSMLDLAIDEYQPGAFTNGPVISVPMPDGTFSRFHVAYTAVMPKALAASFPTIKTFIGTGIDNPNVNARFDYTEFGFHAMIMSPDGWVFIDPASLQNSSEYISYYKSNTTHAQSFVCETENDSKKIQHHNKPLLRMSGNTLKTYRLALACTGEYAAFYGGTVSGAMAGMVTSVNRVTGVYEVELAVRLVLIANNNLLIYTSTSDPYTNSNGSTMLTQNQSNVTSVIGSANYDIGHVFSTGGGGVAGLGVVCSSSQKAWGVTGSGSPIGDAFDIDYVAHEMGHQFGGNHTFNSVTGSCGGGNREASAAYEPGSGTTIMAYAGICGADDIQPHSDAIFHTKSYDEIQIYITSSTGSTCPVSTSNGNTAPVVVLPPKDTIPFLTSFTLTGTATDANGDPLTYIWEEYDLGSSGAPNSPSGNAPIFRDWTPSTNPVRTFPRIEAIVRNTQTKGEILPTYARNLAFRFTARDNKPNGGGVQHDDNTVQINVINTTDTFKVTSPNTNITWTANASQTVTWKVANTTASPISVSMVNILLSLDSGYTFPYTLATNTANDGSEVITVPNVTGTKARVKVAAVGSIFFDMSNVNFTITGSGSSLTTITTQPLSSNTFCAGAAVSVTFTTNGAANAGNVFTAQLSNSAGGFGSPVSIGTLTSVNAGTINATIPAGTAAGSGYLIRVVSSNPSVTGSTNGTNITISQAVIATGTITGTSTVCQGQTGIIYTTTSIGNATSYVWTVPATATITSATNGSSITVSYAANATSGTITVRGTNASCGNGPVSAPYAVTVNSLPNAAGAISGITSICQGQSTAFSVNTISGATGYNWTLPSGATITAGNNSPSITVSFSSIAQSGNISVAGTNSCGNGTSFTRIINVLPVPITPTISAGGTTSICNGSNVTLSYSQGAGKAYQWRKNNVAIAGETGPSYPANSAGTYDVISDTVQTFSNLTSTAIPDNSCTGISNTIAVSGYTGTVISAGISVKLNITHPYIGDLVLVLQAPNGALLGLTNQIGGSGDNFTNTVFSDAGIVLPATSAPYTGTYKPAGVFTNCATTTAGTFNAIGPTNINPNGNWILRAYDIVSSDSGTISNWAISFPATVNGPCFSISNQIAVTVNPTSPVSVSITANPGNTICNNTNVTFTATPVNSGVTPFFQWKNGVNNVGTNSPTYSTNSLANGDVITCVLTSNISCPSGPATSNAITMNVSPNVTAGVSISANTGNTICAGTNVVFTATPSNGGSSPAFQWKKNGNNVGTNNISYSDNTLINGDLILCMMTSNANCITGSPVNSGVIAMTVNSFVTPSVSISSNAVNEVCANTPVTFTAAPVNGGVTPSYHWMIGSNNVGTNSPTFITSSLMNGDVVTCVLTSSLPCVTTNNVVSNTISLPVNQIVTGAVSIAATPGNTVCNGENVLFTATPINGGQNPSFQWKLNNAVVGTNSATYSNNTLSTGDVVICKMISNADCISGNPANSNSISMTVLPSVIAAISISANPGNIICSGTGVVFTAAPTNGGTNPAFQWMVGNNLVGTNSPSYNNATLADADVVTCVLTSNAGCVNNNPITSNAITMSVTPSVNADVNITANPGNIICPGNTISFTAVPVNGGIAPSYQWKNGLTDVGSNSDTYSSNTFADGDIITCVMTSDLICVNGNPATSNAIIVIVNPSPVINSFNPVAGSTGVSVTINGIALAGTSSVTFNGEPASFTVDNNNQITAIVPSNATTGIISVTTSCGITSSIDNFVIVTGVTINLRVLIEGFHTTSGQMVEILGPSLTDSVQVSLAKSTAPFPILHSVKSVINSNGDGSFVFPSTFYNDTCFLVVSHRNSLQTWSSSPLILAGTVIDYDFTTAANKAFGNNLVNTGGEFAIRSGDVNQDGIIDLDDMIAIENSISLFQSGYISPDLNGDNMVESTDMSIVENNLLVYIARP